MTSGRMERIVLGSCIPPALGGLIFYVYLFFFDTTPTYSPEWADRNIIAFISGGYFAVLIFLIIFLVPSILYSLIMEFVVQKIDNNILVIIISMLLGTFITGFFGFEARLTGGGVGLIIGYYLRRNFKLMQVNKLLNKDKF